MSKKAPFSTTTPILSFEDFQRATIPTKLHNLILPPKEEEETPSFPLSYQPSEVDVVLSSVNCSDHNAYLHSLVDQFDGKQRRQFAEEIVAKVLARGGHFLRWTALCWQHVDRAAAEKFVDQELLERQRGGSSKQQHKAVKKPVAPPPKPTVVKSSRLVGKHQRRRIPIIPLPVLQPKNKAPMTIAASPEPTKSRITVPRKVSLEPPPNPLELLSLLASELCTAQQG